MSARATCAGNDGWTFNRRILCCQEPSHEQHRFGMALYCWCSVGMRTLLNERTLHIHKTYLRLLIRRNGTEVEMGADDNNELLWRLNEENCLYCSPFLHSHRKESYSRFEKLSHEKWKIDWYDNVYKLKFLVKGYIHGLWAVSCRLWRWWWWHNGIQLLMFSLLLLLLLWELWVVRGVVSEEVKKKGRE